jgi:ribosome maturation factor RimP
MAGKTATAVSEKIESTINGLGYCLLDVEYSKAHDGYNLTVFIDVERGITIDDCETVHRAIDPLLDEIEHIFADGYILNVSSPGLLRPLKNPKDFARNIGKPIKIKLYAPDGDGKKTLGGILVSFTDDSLTIKDDAVCGGEQTVLLKNAADITPDIKF